MEHSTSGCGALDTMVTAVIGLLSMRASLELSLLSTKIKVPQSVEFDLKLIIIRYYKFLANLPMRAT